MKDLLKLYSIESVNPNEKDIIDFVCSRLQDYDCNFTETEYGIVGETPTYEPRDLNFLLSAHLDMVRTNGAPCHFYKDGDEIHGYNKDMFHTSLGADDKNGVWLIMKLAERGLPFKFCLSVGEEVGGIGISGIEIPEADIALVLDRRGFHEVLNKGGTCDYCSTLAQSLCNFWGDKWKTGTGSFSDAQHICELMETVNISVAYYRPHSSEEYTNWKELNILLDLLEKTINEFKHYPTNPDVYKSKLGYYSRGYYGQGRFL